MTPDIEDEQSAMDLARGSAGKELIKFVGIELGGASEPWANLDGKTGKTPDELKDDLVRRLLWMGDGKMGIHGIPVLGPDLDGQSLG